MVLARTERTRTQTKPKQNVTQPAAGVPETTAQLVREKKEHALPGYFQKRDEQMKDPSKRR